MKIVLIIGPHNAGKSTLVRHLSGIRSGSMQHPSERNVARLIWNLNEPPEKTLCLMSSLNEGATYPRDATGYHPQTGRYTVASWHLGAMLDLYDDPTQIQCTRALLCINSDPRDDGWGVENYEAEANAIVNAGRHIFTDCISFANRDLIAIAGARNVQVPVPLPPSNQVAALVRSAIGLL